MLNRETLIQTVGEVPADCNTPLRRAYHVLSMLRCSPDGEIAAAAKSCYDGSASLLGQQKATAGDVVDYVVARAMYTGLLAAETISDEAWMPAPLPSVEELTARLDRAFEEHLDYLAGEVVDETAQFIAWCATMAAQREAEQEAQMQQRIARQQRINRKAILLRLKEQEAWEDYTSAAGVAVA